MVNHRLTFVTSYSSVADLGEFRECVQQAQGGISAAQENTYIEEVDLNRDGVQEYQVELSGCGCCT